MKAKYLLIVMLFFGACKTDQPLVSNFKATAPLVIYKTTADYSDNVPIVLDDKKQFIVSYPSPKDVYYNGNLALPNKLSKGYWLDNMGITKNTVFTSYTYEEYSKLSTAPSIEELMKRIIDRDPFVEVYDCGPRGKYTTMDDVKKLIRSKFKDCNRVK